jgi:hypothetical protein
MMSKPNGFELASLVGGMASIGAAFSMTNVGAAVGIATALLTCLTNTLYTWRRDRREQRESDARLARMEDTQA